MNSLYIHIPFCRKKCIYCDFYSVAYEQNLAADYTNVLREQIKQLDGSFSTIYIGGGTPTVLGREALSNLLGGLKRFIGPEVEFTVEANPESLSKDILELFLDSGVNRLSLGIQSFDNDKLKKLGRIHNGASGQEAVYLAQDAGFKNISIDLIFGVWNETPEDWKQELRKAAALPIQHISGYSLTYEKDTPLFELAQEKKITPLEDEIAAQMYEETIDFLQKEGFNQYEVSNFAKEGYACRHNQNYWENNSYIGLGASAVSYVDGIRKENVSDAGEYIARYKKEESLEVFQEELSPIEKAKETAAVKIRTNEGIDFNWFKQKTGFDFGELQEGALSRLTDKGLISYNMRCAKAPRVHLTPKGFLFADTVSGELL
ncbi:radical SAM family heme chaperone HemW [bacterium]|nr:MAG: radical SAM family heme chaperone HemW [bacterium]